MTENQAVIGIITGAVGSIATVIGIWFVWMQVRASQKIAKGEFLLHLGELFQAHEREYRATINADWKPDSDGVSEQDMDSYLALFEQVQILIDYKIIDLAVFDRLFAHRIMYLILNDYIYQTELMKRADWRPDLIRLAKAIAQKERHRLGKTLPGIDLEFMQRADKLSG